MDTARHHPLVACGLTVAGAVMFVAMSVGFRIFFEFARRMQVLDESVFQVLFFLFLFLLAGSVPFVASTLFHSADYGLLFASPVTPRAVVAAKLLDATVTNSLQFSMLGIPAMVACVASLSLPFWGWLVAALLIAGFILMPALATALALLIALALLGMRRLRAAIALINGVMAAAVCLTMVLEAGHMPLHAGMSMASPTSLQPTLMSSSPAAHATPAAWFAIVLLGLSHGGARGTGAAVIALGEIAAVLAVLYSMCLSLGARLLSAASVAEDQDTSGAVAGRAKPGSRLWRHWPLSSQIAGLLRKDAKYFLRDSILVSQLTMPMILYVVPFVLALQDPALRRADVILPFGIGMVAVIVFMQTSVLSLTTLGLENRSFWLLLTGPVSARTVLWAKFLLASGVSCSVGWVLSLICGIVFRLPLGVIALQIALIACCSAGLCGLGIGISGAFPRFSYENPAHRVSTWALILGFVASTGYLFLSGLVFGLAWWLTTELATVSGALVWTIAALLYVGLTTAAVFVPIEIGARRIESYQWVY